MTKAELSDVLAAKREGTKAEAGCAFEVVIEALQEALAHSEAITRPGFGTFDVAERAASEGRNPRTGATLALPAAKVVKVKVGVTLKQAVGGVAESTA
jgi:DNA-binding protein HU-beta